MPVFVSRPEGRILFPQGQYPPVWYHRFPEGLRKRDLKDLPSGLSWDVNSLRKSIARSSNISVSTLSG